MVWRCAEEEQQIYFINNAEDGATRQEIKRKTKEEIHGCSQEGRADSWCEKRSGRGQGEMEEEGGSFMMMIPRKT